MTIDQQFVEYIIKSIVGDPDAVHIDRTVDEKGVLLTLTVAPDDLGRVIGKRGTTAQSVRTLLRALGTKNDARYNLKIVDLNRPEQPVSEAPDVSQPAPEADQPEPSADETAPVEATAAEELADENVTEPAPEPAEVAAEMPSTEPVNEPPVEETTPVEPEDDHSDVVSKTRAELEEFDDLDI